MNYDLSQWHKGCPGPKSLVATNGTVYIYCPDCGIVANLEAVSAKISPADASKTGSVVREVIGEESAGIHCGGVK